MRTTARPGCAGQLHSAQTPRRASVLPRATGTDTELRVPRARKPEPELVAPDVAKAMAARPVPVSFADAMAFSGFIPELLNGRLAMLGFAAGAAAELRGGGSLLTQASGYALPLVGLAFALSVASVIPVVKGAAESAKGVGPFTRAAEVANARLAMLALVTQVWLEAHAATPGETFF